MSEYGTLKIVWKLTKKGRSGQKWPKKSNLGQNTSCLISVANNCWESANNWGEWLYGVLFWQKSSYFCHYFFIYVPLNLFLHKLILCCPDSVKTQAFFLHKKITKMVLKIGSDFFSWVWHIVYNLYFSPIKQFVCCRFCAACQVTFSPLKVTPTKNFQGWTNRLFWREGRATIFSILQTSSHHLSYSPHIFLTEPEPEFEFPFRNVKGIQAMSPPPWKGDI